MPARNALLAPFAAALALSCAAPPAPLQFEGEVPFLPGFQKDTGLQPAGSPAQVRVLVKSGGGMKYSAKATASGELLTPEPGSGTANLDGKLSLEVYVNVDYQGVKGGGLVKTLSYGIEPSSATFEPFLLDSEVSLKSAIPKQELGRFPTSVPGTTVIISVEGGELTTRFQGTCAQALDGVAQYWGEALTGGTLKLGASVEVNLGFTTKTFGPFALPVEIPGLSAKIDLGARSVRDGSPVTTDAGPCTAPGAVQPRGDGGSSAGKDAGSSQPGGTADGGRADDGGSATADGGAVPDWLAEGEEPLLAANCRAEVRCGFAPNASYCSTPFLRRYYDQLLYSVRLGRMAPTSKEALTSCLAELDAVTCTQGGYGAPSCSRLTTGLVANGASCSRSGECLSGACSLTSCPANACCTGVCAAVKPKAALGEACVAWADCVQGAYCGDTSSGRRCLPMSRAGESCSSTVPCAAGTVCASGICATYVDEGKTCIPSASNCARFDNWCDSADRLCKRRISPGGVCLSTSMCAYGTVCTGSRCALQPGEGQACPTDGGSCFPGLSCSNGRCAAYSAPLCP